MTNQEHIVHGILTLFPAFLLAAIRLWASWRYSIPLLWEKLKPTAIFGAIVLVTIIGLDRLASATCTGNGANIDYSDCALMPNGVAEFLFGAALIGPLIFSGWILLLFLGGVVAMYRTHR
jgi:hypothetical protein